MRLSRLGGILHAGALAVGLLLIATPSRAQATAPTPLTCAAPAVAAGLAERFRALALTPDTASRVAWPEGIPVPEPATIIVEADPGVCDRLLRMYFASEGHFGPYREAQVSVVRLGQSFVVKDPSHRAGEWQIVVFLTPEFEVVARWMQ